MSATIYNLPSGCNCDNKSSYTESQITAACDQALQLSSEGQTVGRDKYPHVYNDYEKFNFGNAKKPYIEFPIMEDGSAYNGDGSPGADRVVLGSIATDFSSAVFCAVITHDGSTKNGFTECQDDTVNTDGKGSYKGSKKGKGEEEPSGRETLDSLDF